MSESRLTLALFLCVLFESKKKSDTKHIIKQSNCLIELDVIMNHQFLIIKIENLEQHILNSIHFLYMLFS
jgi:hypothetical protein